MLDDADSAQMQAELLEVIGDHAVSIVIRRGDTTLAAQQVRIEMAKGSTRENLREGVYSEETRSRVTIVGGIDLDIQKDDRFNTLGSLFRVTAVQPNRQIGVMAAAEMVQ